MTRFNLYLDGAPRGSFDTAYRLRDLIDDDFWLGRSHYGDETASASYNESRIHGVALVHGWIRENGVRHSGGSGGSIRCASRSTAQCRCGTPPERRERVD